MYSKTKWKGDIGEQAVLFELVKRFEEVAVPVGDRLPYDILVLNGNNVLRIQVKTAYPLKNNKVWEVDNRRCRTNQREMYHIKYSSKDFDFAVVYIIELGEFYVIPSNIFLLFAGPIRVNTIRPSRTGTPDVSVYKNDWGLISWALNQVTD